MGARETPLIARSIITQPIPNVNSEQMRHNFEQSAEEVIVPVPTIRDIAKQAGVSHTVVSAILSGGNGKVRYSKETERKVLTIAKRLGYRPHRGAQSLAKKKTLTIGVCFAWEMGEVHRHPAMAFILAGISETLSKHDYSLLLRVNPVSGGYLPKPSLFHPNEVDGVLLVGAIRGDERNLNLWRKSPVPFMLISTPNARFKKINFVDWDNFGMAVQAVKFLAQRGYKRIGLVLPSFDYTCHQENLRGFRHALSELALPFNESWVWAVGFEPDCGYKFAQEFLDSKSRPDALVFLAEMAFVGFGKALIERGCRLPEDLGLVVKEKFPGQTSFLSGVAVLTPDYFQLGAVAAEWLMKLVKGECQPPVQQLLSVPLKVT